MNKIVFKIVKNEIIVSLLNKDFKENLNNTNVINTKETYFSINYINENVELVSSFLNVIIIKNNIHKFIVNNEEATLITLKIIKNINKIDEIYLNYDNTLKYDEFIELLNNNYLKVINLFDIPNYLLEMIDVNKNLKVTIRNEILFTSNFMEINNINTYSDIFYKKEIYINEFKDRDYLDFDSFIQINKYLKIINFNYFSKRQFDYIFNKLIKLNLKNIKINFNEENINIQNVVEYINKVKKEKEDFILTNNINFKINYSKEFKKNNMFKQINLNFIKISLLFIILSVTLMMSVNLYRNYSDTKKYDDIENDLQKIKLDLDIPENNNHDKDITFIEPNDDDKERVTLTTTTTTTTTIYDIKYEKVFEKLKEINNDTVGWLTVNNTKIDYPVVQSTDNDYYLYRDYYKNKNRHGWIYMDYRNNIEDLSDNTIIFGHNLANQKMFGTLRYVTNPSWYKKSSNQIITFNTTKANMKWQIISIYKIPVTNDYLVANFASSEDKLNFLDMITQRSIYDFNATYDENTKIITLSTCSNGSKDRLVVHAKLI
ncbi:MAG: class B sortase [Tenericutes bacterium]|nr:class B sortase [Mycoplasmatota bacterium]